MLFILVKWGSPWRLSSSLHKSIKLLLRADNVPTRPCYTCHDVTPHSRHTSRVTPRPHHHIIVNCWKIRGWTPGRLQSPPGVPKLQQEVDNISENTHCWAAGHWLVVAAADDTTLSEYLILCHKKFLYVASLPYFLVSAQLKIVDFKIDLNN